MTESLFTQLWQHIQNSPFDGIATFIFLCAIIHTFLAGKIKQKSHKLQHAYEAKGGEGESIGAAFLEFFGEVEVIFGLWVIPLLAAMGAFKGWSSVLHYMDEKVVYTEAIFVGIIMAIASSKPILYLSERVLERFARIGKGHPSAWWIVLLTIAPLLGSLITEPAAMTIAALLLGKYFYNQPVSTPLKYATLGLLFVNISIGGTLTHFAAPPIVMVVQPWNWTIGTVFTHLGLEAMAAIVCSNALYFLWFRKELLGMKPLKEEAAAQKHPIPAWVVLVHVGFLIWTVLTLHSSALCAGGFLFFLGFVKATYRYQKGFNLMNPLLVSFFLAGLVTHGTLQGWWLSPILSSLSETPLFLGATILTAFNDNAAITFLATLVPALSQNMALQLAVVQGAVTGGGLTVIANAPNPAGQSVLSKFFPAGIHPLYLLFGALIPTIMAGFWFRI
jgi:hypothetical protein